MAPPMAATFDFPLTFHGVKLAVLMKNSPAVDITSSGRNFSTVVTTWKAPMLRTPVRLTAAGTHRPARAMTIDHPVTLSLLTNCST